MNIIAALHSADELPRECLQHLGPLLLYLCPGLVDSFPFDLVSHCQLDCGGETRSFQRRKLPYEVVRLLILDIQAHGFYPSTFTFYHSTATLPATTQNHRSTCRALQMPYSR